MTDEKKKTCAHDWTYYVNLETKAIGTRRCRRCGAKARIGQPLQTSHHDVAQSARRSA